MDASSRATIDASLAKHVLLGGAPAVAAGVIRAGVIVYLECAGGDGDGSAIASAEHTVFGVASISKTVVALLCVQAAERGELELDAALELDLELDRAVTARQLLQHRSGLVDDESALGVGNWRWPAGAGHTLAVPLGEYCRKRLADEGPTLWSAARAPEEEVPWRYSNLGFALLGLVLQKATGMPLDELARERVFAPLRMADSAFFLSELLELDAAREKAGQESAASEKHVLRYAEPEEQGGMYENAEWPASQLRCTAADLGRWMVAAASGFGSVLQNPASLDALMPSSFQRGLAWWGTDAECGEHQDPSR